MYNRYLRIKGCPRCGGTLLYERAYEDADEVCLQCGYRNYKNTLSETDIAKETEKTARAPRRQAANKAA